MVEVVNVYEHERYKGVYVVELEDGSTRLATVNLAPGKRVYGERLFKWEDKELREWNPYRSKLAAALLKGIEELPIKPGHRILYLGAATGTTPSHVSDIIGLEGKIYALDVAPRVMRELIAVCETRPNMLPLLADAKKPYEYRHIVELVDGVYADVAQPEQAEIVADNADFFLKEGGYLLLAIKARSIDVTKEPSEVFRNQIEVLKNRGFEIVDMVHLEPFDKDHAMVYARYKPQK
ncbi:rRNA 2'-O-methyltransferase fibrillarin [Pyrodictium delaneyi]|uniref:Fibrillarin-like rRNA/tRNA 2'-O-methyltransferase n=1 Tax=Pyrodictium delaneyi TaxID=1273541 RepID=A0A0P0N2N1_9CREN|nr:fibrillarin-like rRNA/tRNA 2'-O-methyltransferase [Pyrodictium delaneyi]ALL00619.1 rRNA 2'-O-methyltransferase fibrillarin [Pyrodictium delaneyi]OWJ54077.1 fibrillarin [Pyrodictium delaneyi]